MRTTLHRSSVRLHRALTLLHDDLLPDVSDDSGQATTEYALVLLGAALVALLVVAWATGGGAGKIGSLFNRVIDSVMDHL